jgi:hypothetical protein
MTVEAIKIFWRPIRVWHTQYWQNTVAQNNLWLFTTSMWGKIPLNSLKEELPFS